MRAITNDITALPNPFGPGSHCPHLEHGTPKLERPIGWGDRPRGAAPDLGSTDAGKGVDELQDELERLIEQRKEMERLVNDRGNGMQTFIGIPPSERELDLRDRLPGRVTS